MFSTVNYQSFSLLGNLIFTASSGFSVVYPSLFLFCFSLLILLEVV